MTPWFCPQCLAPVADKGDTCTENCYRMWFLTRKVNKGLTTLAEGDTIPKNQSIQPWYLDREST